MLFPPLSANSVTRLQRRHHARGSALLEGVLALLILTIGVAALANVASRTIRHSRAAAYHAQALRLLHDGAEQQRLSPSATPSPAWQRAVAAALPNGQGIAQPHLLTVRWQAPGSTQVSRLTLTVGESR